MIRRMLIFCVLILASIANADSAILLDKVIAIVNKEVITWSDLYKAMEFEAPDAVKAMKAEDKRKFFKESEMSFLENLINTRLQLQEAAKAGISASEDDINKAIDNIKKKYSMTDEMFKEAISREGFTMSEYRKKLAEQITISRIVEQEIRSRILVTEGEIDRYLSERKNLLKESEGFHISHIFLKKTEDKRQVEEKAMDIYKKIKAGESFSDLARQYSEDASARSGGDLGFIRKSDMSKDFLAILAGMKNNDVSEPFWDEAGIHIIKLNRKFEVKSEQDLRESAKIKLMEEKFNKQYKDWVKGLREKAYVEVKI